MTLDMAVEILRRAARLTRQEAYSYAADSNGRGQLLQEARGMDALAANTAMFAAPVHKLNGAMRRAIELALRDVDEQTAHGIPRQNQHIAYHQIFSQVRGEFADQETVPGEAVVGPNTDRTGSPPPLRPSLTPPEP